MAQNYEDIPEDRRHLYEQQAADAVHEASAELLGADAERYLQDGVAAEAEKYLKNGPSAEDVMDTLPSYLQVDDPAQGDPSRRQEIADKMQEQINTGSDAEIRNLTRANKFREGFGKIWKKIVPPPEIIEENAPSAANDPEAAAQEQAIGQAVNDAVVESKFTPDDNMDRIRLYPESILTGQDVIEESRKRQQLTFDKVMDEFKKRPPQTGV